MRIQGTGREGEVSVQTPRWVNNVLHVKTAQSFPKLPLPCVLNLCWPPAQDMCLFSVHSNPASPKLFFHSFFSLENNPTLPPPSPQGPTAAFERFVWNLFKHFSFLAQKLFEWIMSQWWISPRNVTRASWITANRLGKSNKRQKTGKERSWVLRMRWQVHTSIPPDWQHVLPRWERDFSTLLPRLHIIYPDTIIKLRSRRIVRNDNSTFVIQLQINPLCSVLLHRFWYYSSILTVAYYCHTKMLPEP